MSFWHLLPKSIREDFLEEVTTKLVAEMGNRLWIDAHKGKRVDFCGTSRWVEVRKGKKKIEGCPGSAAVCKCWGSAPLLYLLDMARNTTLRSRLYKGQNKKPYKLPA